MIVLDWAASTITKLKKDFFCLGGKIPSQGISGFTSP